MKTPSLSPEAQYQLDELESATVADGGDWLSNYMAMLKKLAERNISDVTEWETKGQGIEVLEKSREKHRIAVELKAYAITQIPVDISTALAKLPESATLDEFLERLMPHTGKVVQHERVMKFLANRYEGRVDVQMVLHPRNLSRAERITQMARDELEIWGHTGLSQESQYWLQDEFRAWWKTQSDGNPLTKTNKINQVSISERRNALIKLLPTQKAAKGFSSREWENKATVEEISKSPRTFRRDIKALVDDNLVHKQGNGSFRQLSGKK